MGIGDKVRAAEEQKREAALNAEGKLSGAQLKELVSRGMQLTDARELAASGIRYDEILEIAEAQARTLALARGTGDIGDVLQQNAAMMEKVIEKARNRRPESYNGDFPFPNINALNPDGDAAPPPPFKCEFFEGFWDATKKDAVLERPGLEHNQLTKTEIRLLNQLEGGEFRVDNYDGEPGLVRIVAKRDEASDRLLHIAIVYPHEWVNKASKGRKKPALVKLLADILNIGSHRPADIQQWLAERESQAVAA